MFLFGGGSRRVCVDARTALRCAPGLHLTARNPVPSAPGEIAGFRVRRRTSFPSFFNPCGSVLVRACSELLRLSTMSGSSWYHSITQIHCSFCMFLLASNLRFSDMPSNPRTALPSSMRFHRLVPPRLCGPRASGPTRTSGPRRSIESNPRSEVPLDLPPATHAVQLFFTQGSSTFEAAWAQTTDMGDACQAKEDTSTKHGGAWRKPNSKQNGL